MPRIKVTGIKETVKALEAAGANMQEMRDLMHATGEVIAKEARAIAPRRSGTLAADIRAGRGKTKAVVRSGRARIPYAPIINYGWPARGISPRLYMQEAEARAFPAALATFDKGISDLLKKNGL